MSAHLPQLTNPQQLEGEQPAMSNFHSLDYMATDVPPDLATGWDGTEFTVTLIQFNASAFLESEYGTAARHDHPGSGHDVTTMRKVPAEITAGRITWPDGPQPPAWFTTAAEAMLEGVGR